jgi:hypothetical protein
MRQNALEMCVTVGKTVLIYAHICVLQINIFFSCFNIACSPKYQPIFIQYACVELAHRECVGYKYNWMFVAHAMSNRLTSKNNNIRSFPCPGLEGVPRDYSNTQLILNLDTSCRRVVNFSPRPLYPKEEPRYLISRRMGGSRSGLDVSDNMKNPLFLRDSNLGRSSHSISITNIL